MMVRQFNYKGKGIVHRTHRANQNSIDSYQSLVLSLKHLTYRNQILAFLEELNKGYSTKQLEIILGIKVCTLTGLIKPLKVDKLVCVQNRVCELIPTRPKSTKPNIVEHYYSVKKFDITKIKKEQPQQSLF
jgi:hypothetical protein